MIESLTNLKIKYLVKLKQKKYRSLHNQFLVEGEHLVFEAKKSNMVETIFYTDDNYGIEDSFQISNQVMLKISELGNSKGVVAICNKQDFKDLSNKILMLDGIQDPGNLGTLIRSAAAFGFKTIIAENTVDFFNEKVIRSSQGAIFYVNLIEANLSEFIEKNKNYHYYGTDVLKGQNLKDVTFGHDKIVIVLGNEGNGVRDIIKSKMNTNIRISMQATESLNVGVAGGILMYEAREE
ncbi:MAG: RNA methyltransferase [Tenericutes bacterium]|nr:RNA methyltransferase [Mycoplasmatota bacterium]